MGKSSTLRTHDLKYGEVPTINRSNDSSGNQPSNPPQPTTNRPLDDDDETRIGLAQFCVCTDMLSPSIGIDCKMVDGL
jgi:hypothetical protein